MRVHTTDRHTYVNLLCSTGRRKKEEGRRKKEKENLFQKEKKKLNQIKITFLFVRK